MTDSRTALIFLAGASVATIAACSADVPIGGNDPDSQGATSSGAADSSSDQGGTGGAGGSGATGGEGGAGAAGGTGPSDACKSEPNSWNPPPDYKLCGQGAISPAGAQQACKVPYPAIVPDPPAQLCDYVGVTGGEFKVYCGAGDQDLHVWVRLDGVAQTEAVGPAPCAGAVPQLVAWDEDIGGGGGSISMCSYQGSSADGWDDTVYFWTQYPVASYGWASGNGIVRIGGTLYFDAICPNAAGKQAVYTGFPFSWAE